MRPEAGSGLKIGIVAPGGFDMSGRERVVPVFLWLVERLARTHEVHVFTLCPSDQPATYCLLGATVHNLGSIRPGEKPASTKTLISKALGALRQEHGRRRFDVIHGLWAGLSGWIAALAGRLLHVRTIITVAGGELVALKEIGYGGQLRFKSRIMVAQSLKWAGAVTCAAEFTRRTLSQRRSDAHLIYLGADTRLFEPPEKPPCIETPRLIHVATLNRVKDQATLIRAMKRVQEALPAAHLNIIGEDTLGGSVQKLTKELGLEKAVHFHGFQPSEVVAKLLKQSHLLLHTSLFEDAGPLVFLEAASSGVPTVGTHVGLIADLAGESAVSVPIRDHSALAQTAVTVLRDDTGRQLLGQRALEWASSHDADWTSTRFEGLYQSLLQT